MLSLNQVQLIKNCFNVRSDIQERFNKGIIRPCDITEYNRISNILDGFNDMDILTVLEGGF